MSKATLIPQNYNIYDLYLPVLKKMFYREVVPFLKYYHISL